MGSAAGGGVTIFHPADDSSTLRKQSNKTAGALGQIGVQETEYVVESESIKVCYSRQSEF